VFPAIAAFLIAIAVSSLLSKRMLKKSPRPGRYVTIDDLRGYLAFGVFLHHSSVWYFYLRTGNWALPPSKLFVHLGQSSVALFFMISGFLFFSKLINARRTTFNWERLYISRLLRLAPLYLVLVLLMFFIVALRSGGAIKVPVRDLITGIFQWTTFKILGHPDLNGFANTYMIIARVSWSLVYEWLFYFSLPAFAFMIGIRSSVPYLVLAALAICATPVLGLDASAFLMFLGGAVASLAVRMKPFVKFSGSALASCLALACLASAVACFPRLTDFRNTCC
jgi:peptidoglycan/LPS O-acetylase OafA/YrhL